MAKQTFTTGQVLSAAQMTSLQQTAMGGGSTTAKTASYTLVAADAGTVVQMNSASATTITVNTALFAAGDTVQIQNIGAGVCTVTAGTATVNTAGSLALSQYEGGQLYFNTTSAALFFDTVQSAAGPTFVGVNATRTNVSSAITANTELLIAFTTEEFDTNGFHDNTTNNSRLTIPAGYAGKYIISGWLSNPNTPGGYQLLRVYKNGAQYTTGGVREGEYIRNNTTPAPFGFSQTITASVADYFELKYQQNNSETVNIWANFQLSYLGA